MTPEPLLVPFTDKGKEVSVSFSVYVLELKTANRWNIPGPMEIGPATSAIGTGCIASGHLRAYARRAATNVQLRKFPAWSRESGSLTRSKGIG